MVKTQIQAGYTVSPFGACFTSPFFLLAASLHPQKSASSEKSDDCNACVTKIAAASEACTGSCDASGQKVAVEFGIQLDSNSGLYYLRASWMDVNKGAFLSSDPLNGSVNYPLSLNKYLYSNANPVMNSDPTGQSALAMALGILTLANLLMEKTQFGYQPIISKKISVHEIYYEKYEGRGSYGLDIRLGALNLNGSTKFPEYNWVQFITTNVPLKKTEKPNVPYEDGSDPESRHYDGLPYYRHIDELWMWQNQPPYDLVFSDRPRRNSLSATTYVKWRADLWLVGVSPKGSSNYSKLIHVSYGFQISGMKVSLYPLKIRN